MSWYDGIIVLTLHNFLYPLSVISLALLVFPKAAYTVTCTKSSAAIAFLLVTELVAVPESGQRNMGPIFLHLSKSSLV